MSTLIKQEIFKLARKRSTWFSTIILVVLQVVLALIVNKYPDVLSIEPIYMDGFLGLELIFFFMVAACSSIITMEFQYNTAKELFYRKYSRGQILISKWITLFLYSVYWFILTYVVTFGLKLIFFPHFDLTKNVGHGTTLVISQLQYVGSQFLSYWLILTLVLLLANLFKSSAVATSVGLIGYFLINIVSGLMVLLIEKWDWIKWNPLTMLMYPAQVQENTTKAITHLTINELFTGNVIYIVIFLGIGYVIYRKRTV